MLIVTVVLAVIAYGRVPLDSRLSYKPPQPSLEVALKASSLSVVSEPSSVTILEGTSQKGGPASVSIEQLAGILPKHSADVNASQQKTTVTSSCRSFLSTPCRYKARYSLPPGLTVTAKKGPVTLTGSFSHVEIDEGSVRVGSPITVKTLRVSEANTSVYLDFAVAPERIDIQGAPHTVEITVPQGVTYRVEAPDSATLEGSDLSRDAPTSDHTIAIDVTEPASVIIKTQDG